MGAYRMRSNGSMLEETIGADFKKELTEPGIWGAYMYMRGETIMKQENHVRLSSDKKDQWGIPLLITSVGYDDNDEKMIKDFLEQAADMLGTGGVKNINADDNHQATGIYILNMCICRNGMNTRTTILNYQNNLLQSHNVHTTYCTALSLH